MLLVVVLWKVWGWSGFKSFCALGGVGAELGEMFGIEAFETSNYE